MVTREDLINDIKHQVTYINDAEFDFQYFIKTIKQLHQIQLNEQFLMKDITIDIGYYLSDFVPIDSVSDAETIRQLSLFSQHNRKTIEAKIATSKIDKRFSMYGLYPEILKNFDIPGEIFEPKFSTVCPYKNELQGIDYPICNCNNLEMDLCSKNI